MPKSPTLTIYRRQPAQYAPGAGAWSLSPTGWHGPRGSALWSASLVGAVYILPPNWKKTLPPAAKAAIQNAQSTGRAGLAKMRKAFEGFEAVVIDRAGAFAEEREVIVLEPSALYYVKKVE